MCTIVFYLCFRSVWGLLSAIPTIVWSEENIWSEENPDKVLGNLATLLAGP